MQVAKNRDSISKSLFSLAFPMIVSQASDTCMMFVDRLFLSYLGKAYLSAAMLGGLSAFFVMTLFFGINGYVNALVAQYYGAGREKNCSLVFTQGIILSLLAWPIILLFQPLVYTLFELSQPDPEQLPLQKEYFSILSCACPIALIRLSFAGFFSGIGKSGIVMFANLSGMLLNIPFTYALVFGEFGCPRLEIQGAAYGTVFASFCSCLILLIAYISKNNVERFGIKKSLTFHKEIFSKLLYYGFPFGLELFLNIAAFNIAMQQFHTYGLDFAAAVSIVMNWELIAFLPMIGLSVATTSMVGRKMGANKSHEAEEVVNASLRFAFYYCLILAFIFLFFSKGLGSIFFSTHEACANVLHFSSQMLRISSFYIFFDAWSLIFAAALRGAGDSVWPMWISVSFHWFFTLVTLVCVRALLLPPLPVWYFFVFLPFFQCFSLFLRFKKGYWRALRVV